MFYNRAKIALQGVDFCTKGPLPQVEKLVHSMIQSNEVVIFSKSYCRYSKLAKEVPLTFQKLKQNYTAIELDHRDDEKEIKKVLGQLTGAETVPRVFINGEFIGGGEEVAEMFNKGTLQQYFK